MAKGTDVFKQLTGAVLPVLSSVAANRLLKNQSPGLQTLGTVAAPLLTNAALSAFGLPSVQGATGLNFDQLLGGGLLLGSTFADQEPGSVTEARQFLRNRFTSPTALSEQFGTQISGLAGQFQPLLTQQRERGLSDIQARFVKAFPASVGAQPREFTALGRYLTEQALPREQALLGNLGLNLLGAQERAATSLLGERAQSQLAAALGNLGGTMLLRDAFGESGRATQINIQRPALLPQGPGGPVAVDALSQMIAAPGQSFLYTSPTGATAIVSPGEAALLQAQGVGNVSALPASAEFLQPEQVGQIAQLLLNEGGQAQLTQLLGSERASLLLPQGPGGPVAVDALSQMIAAPGQSFLYTSPTGATAIVSPGEAALLQAQGVGNVSALPASAGFDAGLAGPGLLGPAGTGSATALASAGFSALGSGYLGYQIGKILGDVVERPGSSATTFKTASAGALGGAAGGAAAGFAVGGPTGAVIGAILGGLAGAFGGSGAERRREGAQQEQEVQATDAQRPAALQDLASFESDLDAMIAQYQALDKEVVPGFGNLQTAANELAKTDQAIAAKVQNVRETLGQFPDRGFQQVVPYSGISTQLQGLRAQLASTAPEGLRDLLGSSETGKFFPGRDIMETWRQTAAAQVEAVEELTRLVRAQLGG